MKKRVDEMFLLSSHSGNSSSSSATDKELIEAINTLRFERFENALNEVLMVAKEVDGGQPTNTKSNVPASVSQASREELKFHLLDMLGHVYMQHHSLDKGPNIQVEDARVAMKVLNIFI
jgi:hypothetical protein